MGSFIANFLLPSIAGILIGKLPTTMGAMCMSILITMWSIWAVILSIQGKFYFFSIQTVGIFTVIVMFGMVWWCHG